MNLVVIRARKPSVYDAATDILTGVAIGISVARTMSVLPGPSPLSILTAIIFKKKATRREFREADPSRTMRLSWMYVGRLSSISCIKVHDGWVGAPGSWMSGDGY